MQLIAEAYDLLRDARRLSAAGDRARSSPSGTRARSSRSSSRSRRRSSRSRIRRRASRSSTTCSTRPGRRARASGRRRSRSSSASPIPTIAAAIDAPRALEHEGRARRAPSSILAGPKRAARGRREGARSTAVHDALYAAKICSTRRAWRSSRRRRAPVQVEHRSRARWRASGRAAASSARASSTTSCAPTSRTPDLENLLLDERLSSGAGGRRAGRTGARSSASPRTHGIPRRRHVREPRLLRQLPHARSCRRTSRRRSATPSAPTPTSATTSPRAAPHSHRVAGVRSIAASGASPRRRQGERSRSEPRGARPPWNPNPRRAPPLGAVAKRAAGGKAPPGPNPTSRTAVSRPGDALRSGTLSLHVGSHGLARPLGLGVAARLRGHGGHRSGATGGA